MDDPTTDLNRRRAMQLIGAMAGAAYMNAPAAASPGGGTRVGVALGSGGLHGYAHIGVIRAFESLGFRPDVITGTSVGAIAGALWASGARANTIETLANDPAWSGTGGGSWQFGSSLMEKLQKLVDDNIATGDVKDLRTRFAAVATDIENGELVLLDRGRPGTVVAASACVPLRHAPILIGHRKLVDGALTAPIPVDAARTLGADFVIAVDVAYRPYEEPLESDGVTAMAFQMMHIMINRLIGEQIRRADFRIRLDLHAAMQGVKGARALIDVGERETRKLWPELQRQLASHARRGKGGG